MGEALDFHIELPASIHRKLVDDSLRKETMVQIGMPKSLDGRLAETLAEKAVDKLESGSEKTGRYNKHVCEDVDESDIYSPQQAYQPTVHQPVTICSTIPLLIHYPTLLSI